MAASGSRRKRRRSYGNRGIVGRKVVGKLPETRETHAFYWVTKGGTIVKGQAKKSAKREPAKKTAKKRAKRK